MKDKTLYSLYANIRKALANPKRFETTDILNDKEKNFGE